MITRRDFLKIAGVTLTAVSLPPGLTALADTDSGQGRILTLTDVYDTPNGHVIGRCLPDSVQPIRGYDAGWVRLSQGYVPEISVQPMLKAHYTPMKAFPAWLEVTAPYTAIQRWCSVDAPQLARLGHGAVVQGVKALDDRHRQTWIQVDLSENAPGWIQAQHLQPAVFNNTPAVDIAYIQDQQLTFDPNLEASLRFALACSPELPRGEHRIVNRVPGFNRADYKGIPWHITTDSGLTLYGAYWHNHFARSHTHPEHIELSVTAAKLIFQSLREGSFLIIR